MNKLMSRKAGSRFAGKKLLLLVPVIVLLAAGCGSAAPEPSSTPSTSQSVNQPANNSTPAPSSAMPSASATWQTTLMASNNTAKGNYMITVSGHVIYLNTSRDYSALVGKPVNISYTGGLASFTLDNITAQ